MSTFPYTNIGQFYTNPLRAIRLYLGCQSHETNGPLILRLRCYRSTICPVSTSHMIGLPFYDGASKYLRSGLILEFNNKV